MKFLSTLLDGVTEYETLVSAVERHNTPAAVTGVSGIHKAHLIHSLCARTGRKALVLASDEGEGQRLCNDLSSMGTAALVYPARDFNFRAAEGQSREYEHQRLQVMAGMLDGDYQVVISCIDAALQYTIPPDELRSKRLTLRAGQEAPLEKIEALLSASGYERYQQVEGPGQFAVRGGILDFFTPDASAPVRVEFWGDEIDTLCYFDPETQRRTDDPLEEITLAPSTEVLVSSPGSLAKKIERLSAGLRGKRRSGPKRGWPRKRISFWRENAREARTNFCRCCTPRRPPCWIIWSRRPWCSNRSRLKSRSGSGQRPGSGARI